MFKKTLPAASLLCSLSLNAIATADPTNHTFPLSAVPFFPEAAVNLLKQHETWQSIPCMKLATGATFQLTPGIQKK